MNMTTCYIVRVMKNTPSLLCLPNPSKQWVHLPETNKKKINSDN